MGLYGNLQTMPILDLFQWLESVHKTGKLTVEGPTSKQQIFFENGYIMAASATEYCTAEHHHSVEAVVGETLKWRRGEFSFAEMPLPTELSQIKQGFSARQIIQKTYPQMNPPHNVLQQTFGLEEQPTNIKNNHDEAEGLRVAIVSRLIKGDFQIPLLATVANKIISITKQDDFSLRDLSEVIITDQVITAQLLKHANSAFYNRGRTIDSVSMAVQLLGAQTVTNLVLTLSLKSVVTDRDVFLEDKKQVWKRSLACALLARSMSLIAQVDREQAFLCGLMIDFGKIVLFSLIQDLIKKEPSFKFTPKPVIDYIIGSYHQKVGGAVAEKWMLPPTVTEAIMSHHSLTPDAQCSRYVSVASLCDEMLHDHFDSPAKDGEPKTIRNDEALMRLPAVKLLGLTPHQINQALSFVPECLSYAQQMAS